MSVCQTSGLLNTNTNLLISSLVSLICLLPVNPNSDAPKGLSLEHEPLDSILYIQTSDLKKNPPYSILDKAPNKVVKCIIQKRSSSLDPACWSDGDEPEFRKSRRRKYESSTSSRFVLGKRSSSACSYFKEYIIKDEDRFDFLSYKHALRTEALIEW